MDHFEIFGLPRRLALDTELLQRKFYELSRQHHPDFHQGESPEARDRIVEASARVNTAYRTLRDPITRIEYLIALEEGRATREGAATKAVAPPELLAEMFEIQEALEEARAGGLDQARRAELRTSRDRLEARRQAEEQRLTGSLGDAWDAATGPQRVAALEALRQALGRRAYLGTVIDDLTLALGEGDDAHVTHHRH